MQESRKLLLRLNIESASFRYNIENAVVSFKTETVIFSRKIGVAIFRYITGNNIFKCNDENAVFRCKIEMLFSDPKSKPVFLDIKSAILFFNYRIENDLFFLFVYFLFCFSHVKSRHLLTDGKPRMLFPEMIRFSEYTRIHSTRSNTEQQNYKGI